MKIIVGFFTTKTGKRAEYLEAARDHLQKSRLDPDCLYIELVPMPDDPGRILLAEAFTSEEAHRRHEDTDHMRALWEVGRGFVACGDRQLDLGEGRAYRRAVRVSMSPVRMTERRRHPLPPPSHRRRGEATGG